VRAGDALRLVADVIEARRSEKRPTLGILRWRWRLFNQREMLVLDVEVTSLFRLTPID
jgi:acyl dehydratase